MKKRALLFVGILVNLTILALSITFLRSYINPETEISTDVLGVDSQYNLQVQNTILSHSDNNDGSFSISYRYVVTNPTAFRVNNVAAINNLANVFSPYLFEILNIESINFSLNSNFDGVSDTSLLIPGSTLNANSSGSIDINLRVITNGAEEQFENFLSASGDFQSTVHNNPPTPPSYNPGDNGDGEPGEDGPPVEETNLTAREFSFYLINADTRETIMQLTSGQVVDVDNLPTQNLTIMIDVNPPTAGSVVIGLNENPQYRVENSWEYVITNDLISSFESWNYLEGNYTITASAYTQLEGLGQLISSGSISFRIENAPTLISGSASVVFNYQPETNNNSTVSIENSNFASLPSIGSSDEEISQNSVIASAPENSQINSNNVLGSSTGGTNSTALVNTGLNSLHVGIILLGLAFLSYFVLLSCTKNGRS